MTKDTSLSNPVAPAGMSVLLLLNILLHIISGALLGLWFLHMFAPSGEPSGGDILKIVLLTIGVTATQVILSTLALRTLPTLANPGRRNATIAISVSMLVIGFFAGLASASMVGLRMGEDAYQQQSVERRIADVEGDKDIVAQIDALIPTFTGCSTTFADLLTREVGAGAVSLQGRDVGPVSAEISAIGLACSNANRALLSSRAVSSDLFSDMDRMVAKARRIVDNDALDGHTKSAQLVRLSEQLAALHKELGTALSLDALRPVMGILNKDRAAMGLSPEAVATIAAALRPISKAIGQDLDETIETLKTPFATMRPVTNPMEYLGMFPGQMAVAIAVSIVLEATPLILIVIFLLAMGQARRSDDDHDARPHAGDGSPGGLSVTRIDTARITS